MTSTPTLPPQPNVGDDPAAVLTYARAQRQAEEDAAREVMKAAAEFASMHSAESLVGPMDEWHEHALPLGGQGCPEVAEFAVVEFAASMAKSTEAGRRELSAAVEGRYRLQACWARLEAGLLPAWKLRLIAEQTTCLSPEAAAYVDQHVAPVAHKIGPAQLTRTIEEARARFAPELTEAERQAAAEGRRFDVDLAHAGVAGTVRVEGELDVADALDLEAAVAAGATALHRLGSTESLDVRRSMALGDLARGQQPLDLESASGDQPRARGRRRREVVLHVHLTHAALLGAGGLARLEEVRGPVTVEQVRAWCAAPDAVVTVKPVIDLDQHVHVEAYEVPDRLREQVNLRDLVCAFPFCGRPAERCDCDHRVPYDRDHPERPEVGPTCSCNLAPACRRHHRAKTTGGWTYVTVEPGTYLWRSPLGYQFLKDHHGTIDVTPDAERRSLARTFLAHFGDARTTGDAGDPGDAEP